MEPDSPALLLDWRRILIISIILAIKSTILRPNDYINWNENIPELSVTSLENSLKFYKTAGFEVKYNRPENKFTFISLNNIQFMLQELSDNDKWNVGELKYPYGNGINISMSIKNVE